MKDYKELKDYTTKDLIYTVFDDVEYWGEEAIRYAWDILAQRNIDNVKAERIYKNYLKQEEAEYQKEIESRKHESYDAFDLIFMFLLWPKYLLGDWGLKKSGYIKKYNQRTLILGINISITSVFLLYFHFAGDKIAAEIHKEKVEYINQVAIADSIKKSLIDFSGKYTFVDSSKNESIIWSLIVKKKNGNHFAELDLYDQKLIQRIKCDAVLNDDNIEFYPDTVYKLKPNNNKLGYYDCLFILSKQENHYLTSWQKMRPFNTRKINRTTIFKKSS